MSSLDEIEQALNDLLKGKPAVLINTVRSIAAAGDYIAEDVLSNSASDGVGTAWEFNGVGENGRILQAKAFIQTTNLAPRITLYLFRGDPSSEKDDNAANTAPSLGDWPSFIGQIDFPAMEDLGGVSASLANSNTFGGLPLLYTGCPNNKMYGIAVTRDAITGEAANDRMGFSLEVEQLG